ncbi:MAG: hypothetical protein J5545_07450 [Bacteroidaceae bacterium]|nr:hypothetical protein [Bacteroidaceae bacterium]
MKRIYSLGVAAVVAGALLTACSPEDFTHPSEAGVPTLDGIDAVITVDQTVNQVTFSLPASAKGMNPVWYFADARNNPYSTVNGLQKIYASAGDYTVEMRLMNANGVSDEAKTYTFHIDNTIMDFTRYITLLSGGASDSEKEWRMDNAVAGHFGCGPSGTTGTEWWSADPDNKAGIGIYDNRIRFGSAYDYTFDPGEAGTMYVNVGTTVFDQYKNGATEDFNVPAQLTTAKYEFEVEGDKLYLKLPAHTPFLYVPNDASWENPRYLIESITPSTINLVGDNGEIAWHYILTSGQAVKKFDGFKYSHEANLWRPIDEAQSYTTTYYYAPGWAQIANPEWTQDGAAYSIQLPSATFDQWQAQAFIVPASLVLNSATHYDFSCKILSTTDLPGVTLKLTDKTDDGNFLFTERVAVKAYEEYIFYLSDLPGIDADVKMVFDFGGNPDNTEVTVSNITLKDHSIDDGTVLPSEEPEPENTVDWDEKAAENLWASVESGTTFISVTPWFANDSWSQIGDPEWTHADGVWELTIPEGMGGSQWQGQFPINTSLTASQSKKYNFYCVVEMDNDAPGVTIKLTETDDPDGTKHDGNFFFADRHEVKAFTPFIYKAEGVSLSQNDAHALSLFFDFGGTPGGTHIKISKIFFEEIVSMSYDDENNLWKAVDESSAFISVTPWFANDSWSQIGDPEWSHEGNKWMLTIPEGMGSSQWQGQFPINTTLATAQADAYNFSCTIEMDNDAPGVTIKLTETDDPDGTKHDGNFYFADRHVIKAYEPFVYKATGVTLSQNDAHALSLFFDFGGTPIGTNVVIKDIIFEKAQ